jgi:hypothetical protein
MCVYIYSGLNRFNQPLGRGEVEERQEREGGGYPGRVRCRRPKAETDPPKPRERKTKTENRKPSTPEKTENARPR